MPLNDLDRDQRDASTTAGSEIVISAGAGSGKTRLLVGRYLYLIKNRAVPVTEIVAITFTVKAANQMKAAIAHYAREFSTIYPDDKVAWGKVAGMIHTAPISTIHAFCNSILRRYPFEAELDPLFTILDNTTLSSLTREAIDSFISIRMETEPEIMDTLIGAFGMSGLKRIMRTLHSERTQLITFLDKYNIEKPELLERRYIQLLKEKLKMYQTMLKDLLSAPPLDDSLFPVLVDLHKGLSQVSMMCEEDEMGSDFVRLLIEKMKGSARKGSKNKWIVEIGAV